MKSGEIPTGDKGVEIFFNFSCISLSYVVVNYSLKKKKKKKAEEVEKECVFSERGSSSATPSAVGSTCSHFMHEFK